MISQFKRIVVLLACVLPLAGVQAQAPWDTPDMSGSTSTTQSGSSATTGSTASGQRTLSSTSPAQASPSATSPSNTVARPQSAATMPEYETNRISDVFGAHLFTGSFAKEGAPLFNPDYVIAVGDTLQVRFWGGYQFDALLTVDPQGNIFLPLVGPVRVLGVRNSDLQAVVQGAVGKVFRANVGSYASLAAAQPVRIFVTGFVNRPGQYAGTSMDSLLHFLDQAGGIDPERGSFLGVRVQRGAQVRSTVNLYDFLLSGLMPVTQLASGDVIFVPPKLATVRVSGLVENAKRFEFDASRPWTVQALAQIAKPQAMATHVRVVRNQGATRNAEYYPLEQAHSVALMSGDEVEFTADKKPGTITVRVEGEHDSPQEYVLPYGSHLGELIARIRPNPRSDMANLQLFRQSVKRRQKDLLNVSLHSLEMSLLTARSESGEEAQLRRAEAEMGLQWVDRAKQVEPLGQVMIAQAVGKDRDALLLEHGDVLRVPSKDGLVLISGEVLFPNAVAHQGNLSLEDYIQRAGGFTQKADASRVVVARMDGSFEQTSKLSGWNSTTVNPGDQVLVLPKVDEKNRQFWKDMTQIIYQIAVSAKVILGF
jgi:protein involved in polysaccharide export with SLBB domain